MLVGVSFHHVSVIVFNNFVKCIPDIETNLKVSQYRENIYIAQYSTLSIVNLVLQILDNLYEV